MLRDNPWKLPTNDLISAVIGGARPNTELIQKLNSMQPWVPVLHVAERCWYQQPSQRITMDAVVAAFTKILMDSNSKSIRSMNL